MHGLLSGPVQANEFLKTNWCKSLNCCYHFYNLRLIRRLLWYKCTSTSKKIFTCLISYGKLISCSPFSVLLFWYTLYVFIFLADSSNHLGIVSRYRNAHYENKTSWNRLIFICHEINHTTGIVKLVRWCLGMEAGCKKSLFVIIRLHLYSYVI